MELNEKMVFRMHNLVNDYDDEYQEEYEALSGIVLDIENPHSPTVLEQAILFSYYRSQLHEMGEKLVELKCIQEVLGLSINK